MTNVIGNIKLNLSTLSEKDQASLLKVIARISEASYRRGVQQGAFMKENGRLGDDNTSLGSWRYDITLDKSPPADFSYCSFTKLKTVVSKDKSENYRSFALIKREYYSSLIEIGLVKGIERLNIIAEKELKLAIERQASKDKLKSKVTI